MEYALQLPSNGLRTPERRDYVIFFLVMPLIWAFWLATSGIRLVSYMSVAHGYLYMFIHCFAGWWAGAGGSIVARTLLARWRPPVWIILIAGWLILLLPMTAFYYWLAGTFAEHYPAMTPFVANMAFEWSPEYPFKLIRGSAPWLCIWILVVYGYRLIAHVDWFGYPEKSELLDAKSPTQDAITKETISVAVPEFLRRSSRLPLDADIQALKAEEHYVRIWSTGGTDMIRYRFKDAIREMPDNAGAQVHRSWWINPQRIAEYKRDGRNLHLKLDNGLDVPVSLAYRAVLEKLLARNK